MALSLRQRILWWSVGSSLAIPAIAFLFVDDAFRSTIYRAHEETLTAETRLLAELQESEIAAAQDRIASLASLPTLRAAMETGDSATVRQTLDPLLQESGMAWLAVTTTQQTLLASTAGAPAEPIAEADELLREARYYDTGDLWYQDGRLVQVHASGIFFGATPLGVLLGGAPIGAGRVERLEAATQQRIVFTVLDRLVAGGAQLADQEREDLLREWAAETVAGQLTGDAAVPAGEPVREFTLAGDHYWGTTISLPDARGNRRGTLIAFRSLEEAMRPARELRLALLGIALVAILLAFLSSYVLSRRVTHPVNRLLHETVRLGTGNLDEPIRPESDDEIGKLAAGFDQMRISLSQARAELLQAERLSAIGRAASAVVHDIRQPVMAIQGYVALLKEDWDDEVRRLEDFSVVDQELVRLNGMMGEILDFARGGERVDLTVGSVRDLLDEVTRAVHSKFAERAVRLDIEHGYDRTARLDFPRTRRVLENLLRNAAAVVEPGGAVRLRSEETAEGLRLVVEDTGPGIPDEIRDRVFEPFVTHGKTEGTGLGLAIVKAFTERQGGTVRVETSSAGTTFLLDFPSVEAA
jgi:signal transduction histidine kinase